MRRRRIVAAIVGVAIVIGGGVGAAIALRIGPFGTRTPTTAGPVPRFVDETASSGLGFTYDGPFPYAVGGGVAVFDCDGDGRQDLYLAGGVGPAALFRNESTVGEALRFTRLPNAETDLESVNGAYPIDIDSDGIADLMTLRWGPNVALRGLGGCRFERANESWGLNGGLEQTEAFAATWEAGMAWPTVAFGNFADPESTDFETWCQANELVRPLPAGGQRFGAVTPLEPSFCALSMLFSDWDGSGRKDLRVSNDRQYYVADLGEEQLWRIEPNAPPRLYGVDDGWVRVQVEGMGIATYDVTGDGLPEIYLTSQNASKLQTLAAAGAPGTTQPSYRDIGLKYGVNVAQPFTGGDHLPSTAWHPEFDDVNDDGFIDLFVSKGNVTSQPEFALRDPSNLLLGGPDDTFREAADTSGILSFDRGRGAALADFNLDGRLDLVEVNYQAPVRVWRNDGADPAAGARFGSWLAIRLHQPATNVDAIGALIEVRIGELTQRREVVIGGGHAGGELGWVHVGLGPNEAADLRVIWPDGTPSSWRHVVANQFLDFDRAVDVPQAWLPPIG